MHCKLQEQEFFKYTRFVFRGTLCVGRPDNPFTYVYVTGDRRILFGAFLLFLLFSFVLLQLFDLALTVKCWNTLRILSAEVEW